MKKWIDAENIRALGSKKEKYSEKLIVYIILENE